MTEKNGLETELLGQSAFHKLTHGFAIRDRLRDVLAEQQPIERQYRRRDNSDKYSSRTAWGSGYWTQISTTPRQRYSRGILFTTCVPPWTTRCGRGEARPEKGQVIDAQPQSAHRSCRDEATTCHTESSASERNSTASSVRLRASARP